MPHPFTRLLSLSGALVTASIAFGAVPSIQSVVNAASYQSSTAPATWTTISGTNLATTTRSWANGDFTAGNLPTQLDGVSVTINGKAAYLAFISPGQINVLAPDDSTVGSVPVRVTTSGGTSTAFTVNKQAAAPALFAYGQLGGSLAVIQAVPTYELIAPPGLFGAAVQTYTASPGEGLILYATGLGPVTPAQPSGQLVSVPAGTATPVTVTMGGQPATVLYAGIIGSGLYQVNVIVPDLPAGNAPIVVTAAGMRSTAQASVPIRTFRSPSDPTAPALAGCVTGRVDSITYSVSRLWYGQPDAVSIGGTALCATCQVKPPLYPEFAARMEQSMGTRKNIQACYDSKGDIYTVKLLRP